MSETVLNPKDAKKNFYQLLEEVNKENKEIQIISEDTGNNAVLISLEYWQSIKETLVLEQSNALDQVRKRKKDDSGFTNINQIDWDKF
jgi:PHD/YefM family antitoxin component YafN of YafNO toxin-antitoxin module